MSSRRLELVIAGDASGALRAIGQTNVAAGGLGGKIRSAGMLMAGGLAVGAAAAVGLGAALYKVGSDFDDAYDKIRVQTGATGQRLSGLQQSFRDVARDVPSSFGDVSTAIAGVNQRLDISGPRLETVSTQLLNLSRITDTDLNANIESSSRLFQAWQVDAGSMGPTLDMVFRASQATGAGVDAISQAAAANSPALRAMGFSLEESLGLLGQLEKSGLNSTQVLTGMRTGLSNFARDGEAPAEAFRRLVWQIENGTVGIGEAMEVFGGRGGAAMFQAIRSGTLDLDAMIATISGGSDTINKASDDTADFSEKWQLLKNRVFLALEPVATRVFDAVGNGMDRLGPIAGRVTTWLGERLPGAIAQAETWFRSHLLPVFEAAVATVRDHWPQIQAIVTDVLTSVREIITDVVGAVQTIWAAWGDNILDTVGRVWPAIRQTISGALEVIRGVIHTVTSLIKGDWGEVWDGIKQIVHGAWNVIAGTIRMAIARIQLIIGLAWDVVEGIFGDAWRAIGGTIDRAWDGITGAIRSGINTGKRIVREGWTATKEVFTNIWGGIRRAFGKVWEGITGVARTYVNTVKRIITGAWTAIRTVTTTVWGAVKRGVNLAMDGIVAGIRTAKDTVGEVWARIKNLFRSPINAVLRVVVNPFLGFLDNIANLVGLSVPHDFHLDEFHTGGIVPGRGERPALLLGGEGVLNREAMAALGPERFAELNKGPGALKGRALTEFTDQAWGIGGFPGISPIITWGGINPTQTADVADAAIRAAVAGMSRLIGLIDGLVPNDMFRRPMEVTSWPLRTVRDLVRDEVGGKILANYFDDIVSVGRAIQGMGYSVGEHPAFGGVAPVHTDGSYHYRNRAIDVNWYPAGQEPAKLDTLQGWIRSNVDADKISELLWRTTGHYDHLHLAMAKGGIGTASGPTHLLVGEGGREDYAAVPHSQGGLPALLAAGRSKSGPDVVIDLSGVTIHADSRTTGRRIVAEIDEEIGKGTSMPNLRKLIRSTR